MGDKDSVGRPVDCEARLRPVNPEDPEVGELELKGTNVFAGYWNNSERTNKTLSDDGWMRTGDLARQLPSGSYEVLGRIKTVIMTGGFLIRPDEIDEAMMRHESVVESTTVALPDDAFGEIPATAVVLSAPLPEVELADHARRHLEALKVPKHIVTVDHIPRGNVGKAQVNSVREMILKALSSQTSKATAQTETAARIIELAANTFRTSPSELTPQSTQETVRGWDSFSHVVFIMSLEDAFGIKVPVAKAAAMRSIAEVAAFIEGQVACEPVN